MMNSKTFSVPKNDRGLVTNKDSYRLKYQHGGPAMFNITDVDLKNRIKEARASIGKASRDISFSKYSALHSKLVVKGLY